MKRVVRDIIAVAISLFVFVGNAPLISASDIASLTYHPQVVSAGGVHGGVVDTDGVLWMWGDNSLGELGNGTTDDSPVPIKIMEGVYSVTCSDNYNTAAIKNDGSLWIWGDNMYGQIGNNGVINGTAENGRGFCSQPMKILDNVESVSFGDFYSAAVCADGSLWMWGLVEKIGHGVKGDDKIYPYGYDNSYNLPIQKSPVHIMDNVVAVSCGFKTTAVVKDDGTLWEWHCVKGESGMRFGEFYTTDPVKIMDNVVSVSCGAWDHIAIVKSDGSLWMHGNNSCGELGNGTNGFEVRTDTPFRLMDNIKMVSAGNRRTVAVKMDGTLWVWGENGLRELIGVDGNKSGDQALLMLPKIGGIQDVPLQIMEDVFSASVGEFQIAIKNDGTVFTWGANINGVLGNGNVGNSTGYSSSSFMMESGTISNKTSYPIQTTPLQIGVNTLFVNTGENMAPPSNWAKDEVNKAVAEGLVPEYLQWNYKKAISRGDFAGMLINLIEQSSGKTVASLMDERKIRIENNFIDTDDEIILVTNALGIIDGVGGGKFNPEGTLTRAQLAAIVNRVAMMLNVETEGYSHNFTDVSEHWVDDELGWPTSVGIIKGIGDNKFSPDTELTVEQAVLIVYRALQQLKQ